MYLSVDRTTSPPTRHRAQVSRSGSRSCTLTTIDGPERTIEIDAVPDPRRASQWAAAFRRLSWVELRRSGDRWCCTIHGTGHRLPVDRPAPVAVGLALALAGTPLLLAEEA